MSIKTRAQLQAESIAFFPDNDNKEITAERLRNHVINLQDSAILKVGETGIQNVLRYLSSVVISDDYDLTPKKYVDDEISGIDLTTLWNKIGNTLSARGVFGSISGAYGWDEKIDNTTIGAVLNDGKRVFGQATAFTDTFFSVKSDASTDATYNIFLQNAAGAGLFSVSNSGATICKSTSTIGVPVFTAKDSADSVVYQIFANANVYVPGNYINGSSQAVMAPSGGNLYYPTSGFVAYNWPSGVFKSSDNSDAANIIFRYLATGGTVDLHWGQHYLEGNWALSNGAGSYGGGTGVFYFKNASVVPSTDPTGGGILYAEGGALKWRGSSGTITTLGPA